LAPSRPLSEPRGKHFEEFEIGERTVSPGRTITESDVVTFAGLSGDWNPLHTDEEFAKRTPFRRRIAHGMLVNAIASGLGSQTGLFDGTTVALLEMVIRYRDPVFFGDTVRLELSVAEKRETSSPRRGVVVFETTVRNQRGEAVVEGQWVVLMKRRASARAGVS
jgi:acyl dehydratase